MIVRLKVGLFDIRFSLAFAFQFYDSPIKRVCATVAAVSATLFQFYDSPIKRKRKQLEDFKKKKFQFYDSPIKRMRYIAGCLLC